MKEPAHGSATWIRFDELTPNPATKRWAVMPTDGSAQIGRVQWYGAWRKYCFMPIPNCVFEQMCLREIADFCENQTKLHRAATAPLQRPTIAVVIKRLTIRASLLAMWTSYTDQLRVLNSAFEQLGYTISIRADQILEDLCGKRYPLTPDLRSNLVQKQQPEPWELLFAALQAVPTPGKRTAYFTMWETTRLPQHAIDNLNRAELVLVPCSWNAHCFAANGVRPPIRIVHLAHDPNVYRPIPMDMTGPCIFGAAGRMAHGGSRKGLNEAIGCFQRAFPNEPDVRLRVKAFEDCPLDAIPSDSRIEVRRDYLYDKQMAAWLASLTCFISLAKGEGWGLLQHQAMTIGRPVISPLFGGVATFMNAANSYPVGHSLGEPPKKDYSGYWAIPSDQDTIRQLHTVYANRAEARKRGIQAMADMATFSSDDSSQVLEEILKEFGVI